MKRGVGAFFDPDHCPARNRHQFSILKSLGLRHLTIGLETGLPHLRARLKKKDSLKKIISAVEDLKIVGIQCALTVLIGAERPAETFSHLGETARLISEMNLSSSDRIYLSPYVDHFKAQKIGASFKRFREILKTQTQAKVVPYRIDTFNYYT